MTDDMFPGQDRDGEPDPRAAFAAGFADEPPLIDMVPRALAVYERGRRRRQAAGVGGAVAAVAAVAVAATQLFGGAGTSGAASATGPGVGTPSSVLLSPAISSHAKPTLAVTSTTADAPAIPAMSSGDPCQRDLALVDNPNNMPLPNQAAARTLCRLGMTTMAELLPGHTWQPAPDRFVQTPGTYLPFSFAADGAKVFPLALSINPKPPFSAACAKVWYAQTTCRTLTLADGTQSIEFDTVAIGEKPGGYQLDVDLVGGRQLQFATGYQAGGPQPVTLQDFLTLVKTPGFADYLKQYKAIMGL